jgi:hypothetical protein
MVNSELLDVVGSGAEPFRIISELTEAGIAAVTEESAHAFSAGLIARTAVMVVIDMEHVSTAAGFARSADLAPATLQGEHLFVRSLSQAVALEAVTPMSSDRPIGILFPPALVANIAARLAVGLVSPALKEPLILTEEKFAERFSFLAIKASPQAIGVCYVGSSFPGICTSVPPPSAAPSEAQPALPLPGFSCFV